MQQHLMPWLRELHSQAEALPQQSSDSSASSVQVPAASDAATPHLPVL